MSNGLQTADPPVQQQGALGPYLRAIGSHRWTVLLITALTVGACATWLAVRAPTYEAKAELLVTPLPQSDTTFLGVQVLRESSEPTRTMQTAATLVTSRRTAQLTAARLGGDWTTQDVEDAVSVKPQGESNIVAVTAHDDVAADAARIANIYAAAALENRQVVLRDQVDAAILQLRSRQRANRRTGAGPEIARRLTQLELVRSGIDPTFSFSQEASVPTAPAGPPPWLVIPLALLAGLTLATVAAVLLEAIVRSAPPVARVE